jgi:hypothetical protein
MNIDDVCSAAYQKDWRMVWARAFIRAWLNDNEMQISGYSLDALALHANNWIRSSVDFRQSYPIISREDIKEAGLQILGAEEEWQ